MSSRNKKSKWKGRKGHKQPSPPPGRPPAKDVVQPIKEVELETPRITTVKKSARLLWAFVVGFCAIIGTASDFYTFWPKLNVTIGSPGQSNAFSAPLTVQNESALSLHNV